MEDRGRAGRGFGDHPAGVRLADRRAVAVEPPRDPSHGDLATNAAMVLAKAAGTNPRALAALIAPKLEALDQVTSVEVAGPGFINLRLAPDAWRGELAAIHRVTPVVPGPILDVANRLLPLTDVSTVASTSVRIWSKRPQR